MCRQTSTYRIINEIALNFKCTPELAASTPAYGS